MNRVFMPRTEKSVMGKKLVGVHIDKKDANRLALLSLEKEVPRTKILKKVLYQYLDGIPALPNMINQTVERAIQAWKQKDSQTKSEFTTFCNEIQEDLGSHRIEKELIADIIKKVGERI